MVSAPAPKARNGRLGRRSAEDIAETLAWIAELLGKHPNGLRAEEIRTALDLDRREMPKPLAEGLKSGALMKTGERRATVYSLGAGTVSASPKKTTKKRAARRKKKATGKRASKKKAAARERGRSTRAAMEKSIVGFIRASGPQGATKTEWLQSVGLWPPSDDVPVDVIRKAATIWASLEMTGMITRGGVSRGSDGERNAVFTLAGDTPAA